MSDCPRLGKLFGGCRFRPRYDEVGNPATSDAVFWASFFDQKITGPTPRKTYICDVCETCGKTLFRRKPEAVKP